MTSTLLTRVKGKLFIHSRRKSAHALEGAYASLFHGRSLDFEDLRRYEHGDDIRDIDWRATARLSTLLVKRSRASRMHSVVFAVDTGRDMAALAPNERPKSELAIMTVGALGVLSTRHGDDVSVLYGDAAGISRTPPRRSDGALEHALRAIQRASAPGAAPSDRRQLLTTVTRTVSKRALLVIVTDEAPLTDADEQGLRRLRVQHDVLWVTVRDADPVLERPSPDARRDAQTGWAVPAFLHGHADVVAELGEAREAAAARRREVLSALEISSATVSTHDDVVPALLSMLHRRKAAHAGR
ncbi:MULTISPECIES: DUF58 domain-containing protein [unclassified Microbacterium]|uniref:DUF58 domain-containing protein n=1 Tax=unclassified Microbacterium TaxID=2609290 RepID=UPI000B35DBFC|nr:DUF58 domain-containing protein [Microbacterium sp. JB110]RCS60740.1 DUF58 domain-containing protein [Microbacterium sp. JB110]